ncbi:MAG: hypothetical protein KJ069_32135 [Anaerolineae bacterium]|nr:hypothetical protein [Anaerolineae bacterium]
MNQRLIQKCYQHLHQEFSLDTHFAAKAAAAVVVLLFSPIPLMQLPHLPLSQWLPFFVDLLAEGTMLLCLMWCLLNVVGLSRFLRDRTWLEALVLYRKRLSDLAHIPASHYLTALNLDALHYQEVSVFWHWLWQRQRIHPPDCWSKSQAPVLLFQQVSLLLAP